VDLEIFSSEPGAPKWYFDELYFLINKKVTRKKKWNDQNDYLSSLLPNDPLVVKRFLETMEI
jgi:hypothetical protein